MTRYISKLLFVFFLFAVFVSDGYAQVRSKMIDNFDKGPSPPHTKCSPFRPWAGEKAENQLGYCIHFINAKVKLTRVERGETDKALRIDWKLLPYFSWGNWVSIRHEFPKPVDLSHFDGVRVSVKVENPSQIAFLRITLADLESIKDVGKKGTDELWWADFGDVLNQKTEWVTLTALFSDFSAGWGEGVRHNNYRFDRSRIIAYEINIVTTTMQESSGVILVNNLEAFKTDGPKQKRTDKSP